MSLYNGKTWSSCLTQTVTLIAVHLALLSNSECSHEELDAPYRQTSFCLARVYDERTSVLINFS